MLSDIRRWYHWRFYHSLRNSKGRGRSSGRMPSLGLSSRESAAIAAFLLRDQIKDDQLVPTALDFTLDAQQVERGKCAETQACADDGHAQVVLPGGWRHGESWLL